MSQFKALLDKQKREKQEKEEIEKQKAIEEEKKNKPEPEETPQIEEKPVVEQRNTANNEAYNQIPKEKRFNDRQSRYVTWYQVVPFYCIF